MLPGGGRELLDSPGHAAWGVTLGSLLSCWAFITSKRQGHGKKLTMDL